MRLGAARYALTLATTMSDRLYPPNERVSFGGAMLVTSPKASIPSVTLWTLYSTRVFGAFTIASMAL
jgi:hypothetical protein